jgi:hypothetical protein
MSRTRGLTDFFRRTHCKKLIKYDGRSIEFQNVEAGYAGATFKLGDFKEELKKIRESSELAQSIDDYQYLVCQGTRDLPSDHREEYIKLRLGLVGLLTALRATLAAFGADPKGQKKNLYKIVGTMQDIMTDQAKEAVRAMRAGRKPALKRVPRSAARAVPGALRLSGLGTREASKLAKQLSLPLEPTRRRRNKR